MKPWRGRSVILAVSGGGDSVALLHLAAGMASGLRLSPVVAHLDHGARGEASAADARFVEELAGSLGLPFELGRWSPEREGHFESDARKARYAWLARVAAAHRAVAVAVGHQRHDQAETILHRTLRGTGLRGLAGMSRRRSLAPGVWLIRPLLEVGPDELRAYLADRGLAWREDATNADLTRTRARIRHVIIPQMAELNPRIHEALIRMGRHSGVERRARQAMARYVLQSLAYEEAPGVVRLDAATLRLHSTGVRTEVLRFVWRRAGLPEGGMTADRWFRLARRAGREAGAWDVGARVSARVVGDRFELNWAGPAESLAPSPVRLTIPGRADWGGQRLETRPDAEGAAERIDADRVEPFEDASSPYLVVRGPADGDRFDPLGLGGRTQTLNAFLRGRGVPGSGRRAVPMVCDRLGILWVVGHRIAERVRRTESTRRVLGLDCHGRDPAGPGCD